jgi:hypothetical protein
MNRRTILMNTRRNDRISSHKGWDPVRDMSAPRPTPTAYRGVYCTYTAFKPQKNSPKQPSKPLLPHAKVLKSDAVWSLANLVLFKTHPFHTRPFQNSPYSRLLLFKPRAPSRIGLVWMIVPPPPQHSATVKKSSI